jgi:hypothetical protein
MRDAPTTRAELLDHLATALDRLDQDLAALACDLAELHGGLRAAIGLLEDARGAPALPGANPHDRPDGGGLIVLSIERRLRRRP